MTTQVACVWVVGIICATVFACYVVGREPADLGRMERTLARIARAMVAGKGREQ